MSLESLIMDNILAITGVYALGFLCFVFWLTWRKRGKWLVRVKTDSLQEWTTWKKPNPGMESITMEKASDKKAGWSFSIPKDSVFFISKYWGFRIGRAVEVFYNSPTAISYPDKRASAPRLTKQDVTEFANKDALKRRYGKPSGAVSNILFIVIIGLLAVILILNILNQSGVVVG